MSSVPQGPGAQPPFVVAPTEGSTVRLWWGLATGAVALLLVCGGGIAVFAGMIITGMRAVNDQARQVVTEYLTSLERGKASDAYELVCDSLQKRYTVEEFQVLERKTATSTGFTLGELDPGTLRMPVQLRYPAGQPEQVTYQLAQDQATGHIEICGTT
jgi:hypothetical protein